ncbi:MAG: amidohydrolase, partial [Pseudomonadota bacterium]
MLCRCLAAFVAALIVVAPARAAIEPAPARSEGEGPFARLILRNAVVVAGTGAPPRGPVDIVIEQNRIVS